MRLPFRCMDHEYQNTQSRLLLANHGSRLSSLRQKVHTMLETWQSRSPKTKLVALHTLPVAIRKMGNEHLGTIHPMKRTSEIPHYWHWLFHKIWNIAVKQRTARKYNLNLCPRMFVKRDLVWRMTSSARKKDGKFSTNWDEPYQIWEDIGGGAYKLEQLSGEEIPNTWNVSHLKFYFS